MGIFDMNKSGVIEFEEFRKLIKKIFKAVHEGFGQFLEDKKFVKFTHFKDNKIDMILSSGKNSVNKAKQFEKIKASEKKEDNSNNHEGTTNKIRRVDSRYSLNFRSNVTIRTGNYQNRYNKKKIRTNQNNKSRKNFINKKAYNK